MAESRSTVVATRDRASHTPRAAAAIPAMQTRSSAAAAKRPADAHVAADLAAIGDKEFLKILFALDDGQLEGTIWMGRLCIASKRMAVLAGMPAPPADDPATDWPGGCDAIKRGIMQTLTRQHGWAAVPKCIKQRAERCFSAALGELHGLRKIQARGPDCCVDRIDHVDFTYCLTGFGEEILCASRGMSFSGGGVAQFSLDSGNTVTKCYPGGPQQWVTAMAATSARVFLGVRDETGTIQVWNPSGDTWSREPAHNLTGHTADIDALVVLDEHTLISGSSDGTIKVWDVSDTWGCLHTLGEEIPRFERRPAQPVICVNADHTTLLCAFRFTTRTYTANAGTPAQRQAPRRGKVFQWRIPPTVAEPWTQLATLEAPGVVDCLAASPATRHLRGGILAAQTWSTDPPSGEFADQPIAVTLWSLESGEKLGDWSLSRVVETESNWYSPATGAHSLPTIDRNAPTLAWCGEVLILVNGEALVKLQAGALGTSSGGAAGRPGFLPVCLEAWPVQATMVAVFGGTVVTTGHSSIEMWE